MHVNVFYACCSIEQGPSFKQFNKATITYVKQIERMPMFGTCTCQPEHTDWAMSKWHFYLISKYIMAMYKGLLIL